MERISVEIERDKPTSQGFRILARMIARAYLARTRSEAEDCQACEGGKTVAGTEDRRPSQS